MKNVMLLLLLVHCAILTNAQYFNTRGTQIIDPNGKAIVLRGTNLGNWLVPEGYMFKFSRAASPRMIDEVLIELIGPAEATIFWNKFLENYITKEDISYLKKTGMNSIRVPFNYRLFTGEDYMGSNDFTRGFKYLDRVMNWCRQEGLYLLLDMHCAPGGQTGDNIDDSYGYPFLFEDKTYHRQVIDIWKRIATRYKSEKILIGYDLLNEPIAHYFDKAKLNPYLEPLYREITKAIRTVDKNHLIFLGGAQWNSDFSVFGKPFDSKLVYSFHKYWTPPTTDVIRDYLAFSKKYNVPLHCGETGENSDGWVDSFRLVLDSHNISWHYWPYKKLQNTRGIITFDPPAGYDSVIAYANRPRTNFAEVRQQRPADMQKIRQALNGFLENARFANCYENPGYIRALQFKPTGKNGKSEGNNQ